MTSIKCPECGANMDSEGSFCKYCGAKIPDDVKKMALEINDLAQMEKVKLEREKFEYEKAQLHKKNRANRIKIIVGICFVVAAIVYYLASASAHPFNRIMIPMGVAGIGLFVIASGIPDRNNKSDS